jgi:phosphomannomutase
MQDSPDNTSAQTYQCPGEPYRISRAVHLGRLAQFYPKCRDCPHREDTGPLSSKTVRQLQQAQEQQPASDVFVGDGVRGVYLNELVRGTAMELGNALGHYFAAQDRGRWPSPRLPAAPSDPNHPSAADLECDQEAAGLRRQAGPVAVVGYDERLSSPDLAAGMMEGLRGAGCHVVGIGCVTGACLRYAVRYLEADGGVFVTGGSARAHVNGMRFYGPSAFPITEGNGLEK